MASPATIGGADLSALIQIQAGSVHSGSLDALRSYQASNGANNSISGDKDQQSRNSEYEKAKEAATKFEALLIHSMLKSMRKTTMAENTSNQKAMYDDMLDQQLADTMVEAGGLGVAEHMMSQLQENQSTQQKPSTDVATSATTISKLRALLDATPRASTTTNATTQESSATNIAQLQRASSLWGSEDRTRPSSKQADFIQPLKPLAQETAMRLGTTTNAVLAIAALETGWGQSMIKNEAGQSTHNYFGIKAQTSESDFTVNTTTEYLQGKPQTVQARFRSYDSAADGIDGFADFILSNPRYSSALDHAGNPERFLAEIHKAGYATDPDYSKKAISILHQIDSQTPLL